jgi:hypothetical protein
MRKYLEEPVFKRGKRDGPDTDETQTRRLQGVSSDEDSIRGSNK